VRLIVVETRVRTEQEGGKKGDEKGLDALNVQTRLMGQVQPRLMSLDKG
jgi:hypothetical protein